MADIYMTQGDRLPAIKATLMNHDGPVNLTGASGVKFLMSRNGTSVVDAACSIISAATGEVQYDWGANDTATPGDYIAQFEVTENSKTQKYPSTGYLSVQINEAPR